MRSLSSEIGRQCGQQGRLVGSCRKQRGDTEVVPVGQQVNSASLAHQRQYGAFFTLFRNRDQRQDIAMLDQPLPPLDPIKWGAGLRCTSQIGQRCIALHFFKIIVIDDRNHYIIPCPFGA